MAEFLCASCGKNYFQKAALQKHHYQVHKQETCACNECGKILTSKKQLANYSENKLTKKGQGNKWQILRFFKCHILPSFSDSTCLYTFFQPK